MPNRTLSNFVEHTSVLADTDYVAVSVAGKTRKTKASNVRADPGTSHLREMVESGAVEMLIITYDEDEIVQSAVVKWPDGSTGTFTTTAKNTEFQTVDGYTITHATSGKTVTQSTVTRNESGQVTSKPALTVSP